MGFGAGLSPGLNPATKPPPQSLRPRSLSLSHPLPQGTPAHPVSQPSPPLQAPAPAPRALASSIPEGAWSASLPPAPLSPAPRLSRLASLHSNPRPSNPLWLGPLTPAAGFWPQLALPGSHLPLPRQFRTRSSPGKKATTTSPRPFWGWGWLVSATTCAARLRASRGPAAGSLHVGADLPGSSG